MSLEARFRQKASSLNHILRIVLQHKSSDYWITTYIYQMLQTTSLEALFLNRVTEPFLHQTVFWRSCRDSNNNNDGKTATTWSPCPTSCFLETKWTKRWGVKGSFDVSAPGSRQRDGSFRQTRFTYSRRSMERWKERRWSRRQCVMCMVCESSTWHHIALGYNFLFQSLVFKGILVFGSHTLSFSSLLTF